MGKQLLELEDIILSKLCNKREILKYSAGKKDLVEVLVVRENPLTIFVNDIELVTVVCSPEGLEELGVGFLVSEGLITKPADILNIVCRKEEGILIIKTRFPLPQTNSFLRRNIASCCGKGRASFYFINDARQIYPVESEYNFDLQELIKQMENLEKNSEVFRLTGGVHSAALANETFFVMYEDIGRHNAVDKLIGYTFLNAIKLKDKCLILSGRVSSEIIIKAARAQIPLILSRSAPTELALSFAEDLNITVIGFARQGKLNIYTHPQRVKL